MPDSEKDFPVCSTCARWHPGILYSPLIDGYIGRKCLLDIIERNPENEVARMMADELGFNFTDESSIENVCGFCRNGEAVIFDEIEQVRICSQCWNLIKSE